MTDPDQMNCALSQARPEILCVPLDTDLHRCPLSGRNTPKCVSYHSFAVRLRRERNLAMDVLSDQGSFPTKRFISRMTSASFELKVYQTERHLSAPSS